jgi:putative DNA primase/helicase
VLQQMEVFGIQLRAKDLQSFPRIAKRVTCGSAGKDWYKLHEFRPQSGGCFLVGTFGTYRHSGSFAKVDVNWRELGEAERTRMREQRAAQEARAAVERAAEVAAAELTAAEMWRSGMAAGHSPYLVKKGVQGEACRYLPDGSLLVPLIRYDLPRADALKGVQRIYPGPRVHRRTGEALPQKVFTKNFSKPGCSVRLGDVLPGALILVTEGYATGLSIRMALEHMVPVFVALDAGNLGHVVPMLRALYPDNRLLVCADDDWQTRCKHTGRLTNPGRTAAMAVARQTTACDVVWPVFDAATRQHGDTDFNDLHARQGLGAVTRQLGATVQAIRSIHG